jgi:hypothetical protein
VAPDIGEVKILDYLDSNSDRLFVQPAASRDTDCAIVAPLLERGTFVVLFVSYVRAD